MGAYAPPDDVQDFADFVTAVAGRYRGRVRYYQIWNEPNIYPEWGNYPISPEDYTALLAAGAVDVERMITQRFTLDQAVEAVDFAEKNKETAIKVMVNA